MTPNTTPPLVDLACAESGDRDQHKATVAHTPGPWTYAGYPQGRVEAGGRHVATATRTFALPIIHANARLIAAAPDLLNAVYEALEFVEDQEDVVDPYGELGDPHPNAAMALASILRAAIAKAGGQS